MKVIFLFGGLPHYYNAILNRLHALENLEIQVVIPQEKGKVLKAGVYETEKGIDFNIHRLPEKITLGGWGKAYFAGLKTLIDQEKPQILVLSYPYMLGYIFDFPLRHLCRKLNIKIILKEIPYQVPLYQEAVSWYFSGRFITEDLQPPPKNNFLNRFKFRLLAEVRKYYFNLADAHVNYIEEAYAILGSYGVGREKIFITYNSPDTDEIFRIREQIETLPPVLPPHPHRLIHVGRLVKWKKVHLLLQSLAELKTDFPDIELLVVGEGPEKQNLHEQAEALGIKSHLHFAGAIHDMATLGRYLLASTIYVLAGVGGLSINDAMCFGKPVICSEADGTEKILVQTGQNGFFFENDNPADLSLKIRTLLADPDLIKKMGEQSEKTIREKINVHTVVRGYVAAFNFVTGSRFSVS
jgi:glycosyltransferase involved in cell wall biosynthesis